MTLLCAIPQYVADSVVYHTMLCADVTDSKFVGTLKINSRKLIARKVKKGFEISVLPLLQWTILMVLTMFSCCTAVAVQLLWWTSRPFLISDLQVQQSSSLKHKINANIFSSLHRSP